MTLTPLAGLGSGEPRYPCLLSALGIRKDSASGKTKWRALPRRHDDLVSPIRPKGVATGPIAKTRKPSRIRARDLSQTFMVVHALLDRLS
jgi:hypothetical protein